MTDPHPLLDQILAFADARRVTLPVFSDLTESLRAAIRTERYDIGQIEDAIDAEPALATEVLRAANSAFFGGLSEVRTIRTAIMRLGFQQVTNLVVLATEKNRYTARHQTLSALLQQLWRHAAATALASEWIAKRLRYRQLCEEVFIGGLVHDIGKLFLLRVLDQMLSERKEHSVSLDDIQDVLVRAHAEQGHRLLVSWHLPEVYCTIVRDHHAEPLDTSNVPLLIVRLANQTCHKIGLAAQVTPDVVLADSPEAIALGVNGAMLSELETILEDESKAA